MILDGVSLLLICCTFSSSSFRLIKVMRSVAMGWVSACM